MHNQKETQPHNAPSARDDRLRGPAIVVGSVAALAGTAAVVLSTDIAPGQGTVLGGLGVLGAAAVTFYASYSTRKSNERIEADRVGQADKVLEQSREHFDTQHRFDSDTRAADRAAETSRDLRARFTTAATHLADDSPTIRLAGVYSLASLADDWAAHNNPAEQSVCVALLLSYLRTPQTHPAPESEDAGPHLHVRETIVRQVAERWHLPTSDTRSWKTIDAVTFKRCDLNNVDLRNAKLHGCDFTLARMERCKLSNADLTEATLTSAQLSGAVLVRANLTRAMLRRADCSDVSFKGADLTEVSAIAANFEGAEFSATTMRDGKFMGANFAGADVWAAQLYGANFRRGRNLGTATLTSILYDVETQWPDGFTPPEQDSD